MGPFRDSWYLFFSLPLRCTSLSMGYRFSSFCQRCQPRSWLQCSDICLSLSVDLETFFCVRRRCLAWWHWRYNSCSSEYLTLFANISLCAEVWGEKYLHCTGCRSFGWLLNAPPKQLCYLFCLKGGCLACNATVRAECVQKNHKFTQIMQYLPKTHSREESI
jgi:hypothetical protein